MSGTGPDVPRRERGEPPHAVRATGRPPVGPHRRGRLWARLAGTLAIGALAGWAAQRLRLPLPWMIGPLLAIAAASVAGLPTAASGRLRNAGQWLIGSALGLTFTPEVLGTVLRLAPAIALGVLWALALGYGFYRWLLWSQRAQGVATSTAFFSAAIGGASEMAAMADRHGGQVDRVAAAHSTRVLILVVSIPVALQLAGVHGDAALAAARPAGQGLPLLAVLAATAAGGWLFRRLRIANPFVLGALAAAAGLSASGAISLALPPGLSGLAQLLIAATLAVRFTPATVRSAPRWLGAVAAGTLGMIALCAAFAAALAPLAGQHPATLLLATAPGGIAEMAITAAALGLGVPVVTAFHVLRYIAVSMGMGPLWRAEARRLARRAGPASGAAPGGGQSGSV